MNDPGINKIYYIKKSLTSFPYYFTPGTTYNILPYLSSSLTELDFEPGTVKIEKNTEDTDAGKIKKAVATFTISGVKASIQEILDTLAGEPHVFIFGDIEDQHLLCGTNNYRARFNYKLDHSTPPGSIKNYKCTVTWESPHGLVFCTIS